MTTLLFMITANVQNQRKDKLLCRLLLSLFLLVMLDPNAAIPETGPFAIVCSIGSIRREFSVDPILVPDVVTAMTQVYR